LNLAVNGEAADVTDWRRKWHCARQRCRRWPVSRTATHCLRMPSFQSQLMWFVMVGRFWQSWEPCHMDIQRRCITAVGSAAPTSWAVNTAGNKLCSISPQRSSLLLNGKVGGGIGSMFRADFRSMHTTPNSPDTAMRRAAYPCELIRHNLELQGHSALHGRPLIENGIYAGPCVCGCPFHVVSTSAVPKRFAPRPSDLHYVWLDKRIACLRSNVALLMLQQRPVMHTLHLHAALDRSIDWCINRPHRTHCTPITYITIPTCLK